MSVKIKDAIIINELNNTIMFAVGNTDDDTVASATTMEQVKDFVDDDKAAVAFTGSYNSLTDTPNLNNYVLLSTLTSNYYNRSQINSLLQNFTGPIFKVVEELPERGDNGVIYLIESTYEGGSLEWQTSLEEEENQESIYAEYVWLEDGERFELLGTTGINFDNYYSKLEVDSMIPTVNNSTITLTQGGVTKGTFTLNQSSNGTINLDSPVEQVQADWDETDTTDPSYILNKPTIPVVNNPEITISQGGVTKGTFTLNQSTAATVELDAQQQADWDEEDQNDPSYINNKPDTMSLILEYSDNTSKLVDFYIAQQRSLPDYFYIQNAYNGQNTITVATTKTGSPTEYTKTVQYSKDRVNWTEFQTGVGDTTTITMERGEKVYFRNIGVWNYANYDDRIVTKFSAGENHNVGGNILSLTYSNNYVGFGIYGEKGVFNRLFEGDTKLVDASGLYLTAPCTNSGTSSNDIRQYYESLFDGCTSLVKAPRIQAWSESNATGRSAFKYAYRNCTSLTDVPDIPDLRTSMYCFQGTFKGCTSLVHAPKVSQHNNPGDYCYESTFEGCTSLVHAPELPMTGLGNIVGVYEAMFKNCTSLVTPADLPATNVGNYGYQYMYSGCVSIVNPPQIAMTTMNGSGVCRGMFSGCVSMESSPTLNTSTVTTNSYKEMFYGCSSLNYVTTFADDISATDCIRQWLDGVASEGTLHNLGSAAYTPDSTSGIPTGWTETNS